MAKSHYEIAKQLEHNSKEIQNYFEDLYAWQNSINENVETTLNNKKEEPCKIKSTNETDTKECNNKKCMKKIDTSLKRDCNSLANYYNAWDKLDINNVNNEVMDTYNYKIVNNDNNNLYDDDFKSEKSSKFDYEIKKNNKTITSELISKREKECKKKIIKTGCKVFDIYLSNNEKGKISYKNKDYNKCLEYYNDIINYIDFELKYNNIFTEIEKNCNNELHINIMSYNYLLNDKKIEQLFILRTKTLINRSLVFQRLYSYHESIKDCTCILLFYKYFFFNKSKINNYNINNGDHNFTININYIIFKAYYLRGMARYKLRIYKHALTDFKVSKTVMNDYEENQCSSLNINKSIELIETIIKENNIKKYARRQFEYTSTLLKQYKLKPRLLTIEVIPKKHNTLLLPYHTENQKLNHVTVGNDTVGKIQDIPMDQSAKNGQIGTCEMGLNYVEMDKSELNSNDKKSRLHYTSKKNSKNRPNVNNKQNVLHRSSKNKLDCKNTQTDSSFDSDSNSSSSSITLNDNPILSDIEETTPEILTKINEQKNCEKKIKNKINFELLWNSNKIKNNCKNQINILKTAFLEETIFIYDLDKDIYVDILDILFKNDFLHMFKPNGLTEEDILKVMQESDLGTKQLTQTKNNNHKEVLINNNCTYEKSEENKNYQLTCDDCLCLIDILYVMTNYGKEKYVFLFIDKKERIELLNFYNFILNNINIFVCSENCIKQKINALKKLIIV
ncbi:conserved protein, unknown function [Hepatocystis sp. ex Piliocolobus tephrosceles]|nr:conserved protein, unknown function [Hepatocystis sp. ex Piliocolobus tephrosceles]